MRCLFRLSVLPIKRLGKNADFASRVIWSKGMGRSVKAVLGRKEHGTSGKHDSGIIENPIVVKGDQVVYSLGHERVSFFRKHEIVRDADGYGTREDDWKDKKGVHPTKASNVEVHVNAAIMMEDEVANGIRSLNSIGV
jgi:hypothetical protein